MIKYASFIENANKVLGRYGNKGRLFIYSMDVAGFKLLKEYYGEEKCEDLLSRVLNYMKSVPSCLYCERIYNDNILFIANPPVKNDEEVIKRLETLQDAFVMQGDDGELIYKAKVWTGVCEVLDGDITAALLRADASRKKMKRNDLDTPVIYSEALEALEHEENYKELELLKALYNKEFTYHLQAKVDSNNGVIIGAEALARRIMPDGSLAYPNTFTDILEKGKHIMDLDYLILHQVCKTIKERIEKGLPVLKVSVNLSVAHLNDIETANKLDKIVKSYDVPTDLIQFELTETMLIEEFQRAVLCLKTLSEKGYSISIDDFGAGYAGINLCRYLNFEEIKLDKSFIFEEPDLSGKNGMIMQGIARMAELMNTSIIVEGVETEYQVRSLSRIGLNRIQGYYFSHPIPSEEFFNNYDKNMMMENSI